MNATFPTEVVHHETAMRTHYGQRPGVEAKCSCGSWVRLVFSESSPRVERLVFNRYCSATRLAEQLLRKSLV